jgi:hypothetical protein
MQSLTRAWVRYEKNWRKLACQAEYIQYPQKVGGIINIGRTVNCGQEIGSAVTSFE